MTRRGPDLQPELAAFLKRRRVERSLPPGLRERALSRARATVVAAGGVAPAVRPSLTSAAPASRPSPRRRRWVMVAWATGLLLAVGAGGALAALHLLAPAKPTGAPRAASFDRGAVSSSGEAARAPAAAAPVPIPVLPSLSDAPDAPIAKVASAVKRSRTARSGVGADPLAIEIALLQRAQGAYTRQDFALALTLVVEQARRFPSGHLAEEREALRVRSLDRLGRKDDARRAAVAFRERFPRSRLLPRDGSGIETSMP